MTAIEIACRTCAAQPYEVCRDAEYTHAARIEDAAYWSHPEKAVDPAEVDKAIEDEINRIA